MSGESTRYHTKYFKLGEPPPPSCTQIIKLLFFHTLVEMPRITLFGLLSFQNGKNNSSRQREPKLLFCQNLFLPPPASSFVQWTSIRKWDYLWDYHSEIINSVHRHINSSGNNSWTTMAPDLEQYFDAKFKPLSEVFSLKIIFGKKQTQNFPQLDNSHISTIVYWNSRSFNEQSKGSEIYNSI